MIISKTFKRIPAIDMINGKVVRLSQGDYEQVDYFSDSPVSVAQSFEAAGATRIHLVDLDGAKDGSPKNKETIAAIRRAVDCEIELGGGIRDAETIASYFDLGITYLILGSLLIKDQERALKLIDTYPNKIICGIDARNKKVSIEGWKEESSIDVFALLDTLQNHPISSVIYTDIAKDGMLSGPNIKELTEIVAYTSLPVIASGGVTRLSDIHALESLFSQGLIGCIIGKALFKDYIQLEDLFVNEH